MDVAAELVSSAFPGFTLYLVLVTLGIVALRSARYLRDQERQFIDKMLPKVTELHRYHVEAQIEPLLRNLLIEACKESKQELIQHMNEILATNDQPEEKLDDLKSLSNRVGTNSFRNIASQVVTSSTGTDYVNRISTAFLRKRRVLQLYDLYKSRVRTCEYVLIGLGLWLFLGLTALIVSYAQVWQITFVQTTLFLFIFASGLFLRSEWASRQLDDEFEKFRISMEEIADV